MWRNNERKGKNGRGSEIKERGKVRGEEGKDGWMGLCRENPLELVIRLALLLHF